jgi:hypothetical protein
MGHDVFGSLRVYFIYELCIGSIGFIELWDIAQVAFLQLLAYRRPPYDGVEGEKISQVS